MKNSNLDPMVQMLDVFAADAGVERTNAIDSLPAAPTPHKDALMGILEYLGHHAKKSNTQKMPTMLAVIPESK